MSPDDTETYHDVLYSTLAHPHRRLVLRYLLRNPRPVPTAELATEIGVFEAERPASADDAASLLGLYHVHLPKLLEAGLVELDAATNTVSLSPQAATVPLDSTVRHGLLNLPDQPSGPRSE